MIWMPTIAGALAKANELYHYIPLTEVNGNELFPLVNLPTRL
jgi:hypothetical protein